ncbi:MAG: hypothetical protein ACTS73_03200 [Arsenophonus sp. NEOnobi-MAG3]
MVFTVSITLHSYSHIFSSKVLSVILKRFFIFHPRNVDCLFL